MPHRSTHLPLPAYLRVVTAQAGYHIDDDELPVAAAFHPGGVAEWIHAAARHAAACHLHHLLDEPIGFLRDLIAGTPVDDLGPTAEQLAHLVACRDSHRQAAEQALADLTRACRKLKGTGLLWPAPPPTTAPTADGRTAALRDALTALGLNPDGTADHLGTAYLRDSGRHRLAVTIGPPAHPGVDITVHDGHVLAWHAGLHPDTPVRVIADTTRAALYAITGDPNPSAPDTAAPGNNPAAPASQPA